MIAGPIRVPGVTLPTCAAPAMGADTDVQLRAAGYSDERIAALRAAGVVAGAGTPQNSTVSEAAALAATG